MKKKVTLSLSEEAIKQLKKLAEQHFRNSSNMVEQMIMNYDKLNFKD